MPFIECILMLTKLYKKYIMVSVNFMFLNNLTLYSLHSCSMCTTLWSQVTSYCVKIVYAIQYTHHACTHSKWSLEEKNPQTFIVWCDSATITDTSPVAVTTCAQPPLQHYSKDFYCMWGSWGLMAMEPLLESASCLFISTLSNGGRAL